ncbi:MAG: hypothetical protein AMJ58_06495 [Gammaproteobacteria bacterium SG8_30]|nr:MAG: hypothetical protein AMJ58_06495 [Gammaproteobacteria bacterium SG8_30]
MDLRRATPAGRAARNSGQADSMPPISASEREFWRRAVEAERARLTLAPGPGDSPAPGAN